MCRREGTSMDERTTNDSDSRRKPSERYRYVAYEQAEGTVAVIQDRQNDQAWIQSTLAVAVEC